MNAIGYTVATTGPGSPGHESNMFGTLTKKALMKFQNDHDIRSTGFFGPITRKYVTVNGGLYVVAGAIRKRAASGNCYPLCVITYSFIRAVH